uniref:Uncharacterized protein n=1 Tax=Aegilops tauschii subsp. strangulata TaxID=200361 RepID=A0A453DMC4_AEGTS
MSREPEVLLHAAPHHHRQVRELHAWTPEHTKQTNRQRHILASLLTPHLLHPIHDAPDRRLHHLSRSPHYDFASSFQIWIFGGNADAGGRRCS